MIQVWAKSKSGKVLRSAFMSKTNQRLSFTAMQALFDEPISCAYEAEFLSANCIQLYYNTL